MIQPKQWYGPYDLAKLCGVSPTTIFRQAKAGKIKAFRTLGGHHRFKRGEVKRVLKKLGFRDFNKRMEGL